MSDDIPDHPARRLTILPLDALGLAELQDYVAELRTEIARAEAMIVRKKDHRNAAETVFGRLEGTG